MIGKEPKALGNTPETAGDGWQRPAGRPAYTPPPIESIIGFDALYQSAMKCVRGVLWKDTVAQFYLNWVRECAKLERELKSGTYKERAAKFFIVTEPKRREIMSIAFRDRVYQRSLNDVALYPAVTRSLIPDNLACQTGKGTHLARERLRTMIQRHYRAHGLQGYVLKCDVKGYYPNMTHEGAKACLARYVDGEILQRAAAILDNYPDGVGFNPGSQILQIVGIAMLDDVDHYIKERLRIRGYVRYMDDFILLCPDMGTAENARAAIARLLQDKAMQLNQKKTRIFAITEPIRFLGFDFRLTNTGKVATTLAAEKVKHERKKLRKMVGLCAKGLKGREAIDRHYHDWKVHASYGNNVLMLRRMDQYYKDLWKEMQQHAQDCGKEAHGQHGGQTV